MHWQLILIVFTFIFAALIIYASFTYAEAKLEVESQPREPMFECLKHGLIRKIHLVTFLDQEMCPYCFDERIHMPLDSSVDTSVIKL